MVACERRAIMALLVMRPKEASTCGRGLSGIAELRPALRRSEAAGYERKWSFRHLRALRQLRKTIGRRGCTHATLEQPAERAHAGEAHGETRIRGRHAFGQQ